jgi:predicted nucleic acid-binding protein
MILLDTSAWIEYFKKNSTFKLNLLYKPSEIYLCLPVYQEILQGIGDDNIYLQIKKALDSSNFLENPISKEVFEEASSLYRLTRKKGITIRSTMDCLIATIAIRNNATVLHKDRDFSQISKITSLKQEKI